MSLSLIGCLTNSTPKNNIKQDTKQGYYLKQGEPAPIEGWIIDKSTMYDIMQDALKHRTSSTN